MVIELKDIGKRYGLEWIFRKVNFQFESGHSYALTGHNGSGKSTLLKIISGGLTPSEGQIVFQVKGQEKSALEIAHEVSFAAPYVHLIEDFTLKEMIDFHFKFKEMKVASKDEFMDILGLQAHTDKIISKFSSGMMQRLKLSLAILSETSILLLDEPTSYLDENAIQWYKNLLAQYQHDRLLIIGSNQKHEYASVNGILNVPDFKYERKNRYAATL